MAAVHCPMSFDISRHAKYLKLVSTGKCPARGLWFFILLYFELFKYKICGGGSKGGWVYMAGGEGANKMFHCSCSSLPEYKTFDVVYMVMLLLLLPVF